MSGDAGLRSGGLVPPAKLRLVTKPWCDLKLRKYDLREHTGDQHMKESPSITVTAWRPGVRWPGLVPPGMPGRSELMKGRDVVGSIGIPESRIF